MTPAGLVRRLRRAAAVLAGRDPFSRQPALLPPPPPSLAPGALLEGRRVLVTGAARNIGKAIAFEAARQGAHIVLSDRDPAALERAAEEARALGFRVSAIPADVSVREDMERLAARVIEGGGCDILVNNAGMRLGPDAPGPFDDGVFRAMYETNVLGPMTLTRLLTADLVSRGRPGVVLFVTSIHARVTFGSPSYSSSKAALGMLVEELAVMLAPHHIRVNGIAPGFVQLADSGQPLPHALGLLHRTSIPPEFIGRAAVFLASETFSAHTTGATLVVDDGVSTLSYYTARTTR